MAVTDDVTAMNLPHAVHAQVLKLLAQIARAQTADDLFRASDSRRLCLGTRSRQGAERREHRGLV